MTESSRNQGKTSGNSIELLLEQVDDLNKEIDTFENGKDNK